MIRILFIDDSQREYEQIEACLRAETGDFESAWVKTAGDALRALEAERYDCVVCVMRMPESEGMELLGALRERGNRIPFIVISGQGSEETASKAFRLGADGYWVKESILTKIGDLAMDIRKVVARAALGYRIRIEQLIGSISTSFIGLRSSEVGVAIELALKALGEFACVDRCYIFIKTGEARFAYRYEWCAPGVKTRLGKRGDLEAEEYSWWMRMLERSETIHVPRVAELPEEASVERDALLKQGIKSILALPMQLRGKLYGFLGFDSTGTEIHWKDESIEPLKTVAQLFANALAGKRDREAVSRAQAELEQIFNTSADGMCLVDVEHRILKANEAYTRLAGVSQRGIEGSKCHDVFRCPYCYTEECMLERVKSGEARIEIEIQKMRADGTKVPCIITATQFRGTDGELIGMVTHFVDQSKLRATEEELKESEKRLRQIVENANDVIYTHDLGGNFTSINPAATRIYGYSEAEALTLNIKHVVAAEHLALARKKIKELLDGAGGVEPFELLTFTKSGTPVWLEVSTRLLHKDGEAVAVLGVGRNVTNRKKSEEKLLEYQKHLRSLASELSLAEERLRRRFSTDLHDRIGMSLALAKIKLSELREEAADEETAGSLSVVLKLVEQSIEGTRSLTLDLCPPILHEMGLGHAVEWMAERMREQYGLEVFCEIEGFPDKLDDDISAFLYRALRELLYNVVKHAEATRAYIEAECDDNLIRVTISDDGRGFTGVAQGPKGATHSGFGLFSIRERLKHLGGRMEIDSRPGAGTQITLEAPTKWEDEI